VAQPSDLQTFLGVPTIDTNRATMMIGLAQDLCETILNPLPANAQAVVLAVAARAFTNPQAVASEGAGPFHVAYQAGVGGLFLTRADKANLRRLGGGGGAFSIHLLPPGVSAVQLVTIGGVPTGGTFTLSFVGQTTGPIAYNATAVAVQAALQSLTALGVGNVTVTGANGGPWTVTFAGLLATTPVPLLGSDSSLLTGGTGPSVVVTQVTAGVLGAGQGLPPWDFDYYDNRSSTPQWAPGGFV
jgi:hypothetical protein